MCAEGSDVRSRVVTARRATTVAAAVAAAGAGAALLTHAAPAGSKAAEGGLALSPVVIEQTAKAGTATSITVSNHSAPSLAVTVAARPWRQSVTGAAEPNRRATLRGVALGTQSFPLAARTERTLTVTLASLPSTG